MINEAYKKAALETNSAKKIQKAFRNRQPNLDMVADNLVTRTMNDLKKERKTVNKAASQIQAQIRRRQQNPAIQVKETMDELVGNIEYKTAAQRRAEEILRTMMPSTSTSETMNRPRQRQRLTGLVPNEQAAAARRQQDKELYKT